MLYPFDPSGASSKNRITGEIHSVSPPDSIGDTSFIVPRITPFFADRLEIKLGTRDLVEGVDYVLVFRHLSLSTHLTMRVFGGIAFRNPEFTGTVKISYQAVGGDFQLGDKEILEKLAQHIGRVHYVTFDQIVGTPSSFPPEDHYHDLETGLVNMGDVVDSIEQISTELGKNPGSLAELSVKLREHLSKTLAHTKDQVGLGAVANLPAGTEADLNTGKKKSYVTSDILRKWARATFALKSELPTDVGSSAQVSENSRLINALSVSLGRLQTKVDLQAQSIVKIPAIEKTIAALQNSFGAYADLDSKLAALETSVKKLDDGVKSINREISDGLGGGEIAVSALLITTKNYLTGAEVAKDLGYGTWQRYGNGQALVSMAHGGGVGDSNGEKPNSNKFFAVNSTFGSYRHKLSTSELPAHNHATAPYNMYGSRASTSGKESQGSGDFSNTSVEYGTGRMTPADWTKATALSVGGNQAHNNVQPSIVVGVWVRVS